MNPEPFTVQLGMIYQKVDSLTAEGGANKEQFTMYMTIVTEFERYDPRVKSHTGERDLSEKVSMPV